jgi:hypothetical protein
MGNLGECGGVSGDRASLYQGTGDLKAVAYRRGGGVRVFNPPPPKFRSFDEVEPDCKLSGKGLMFLFQHPN